MVSERVGLGKKGTARGYRGFVEAVEDITVANAVTVKELVVEAIVIVEIIASVVKVAFGYCYLGRLLVLVS